MMRIGFVGLGVMGRPMALHLLEAGYALRVFARGPDQAAPLLEAGASFSTTLADLASQSDVVITMVTATCDVEEVLLGPGGVLAGGEVVGAWRPRSKGKKLQVAVSIWDGGKVPEGVAEQAERLAAFRGQAFGGFVVE